MLLIVFKRVVSVLKTGVIIDKKGLSCNILKQNYAIYTKGLGLY